MEHFRNWERRMRALSNHHLLSVDDVQTLLRRSEACALDGEDSVALLCHVLCWGRNCSGHLWEEWIWVIIVCNVFLFAVAVEQVESGSAHYRINWRINIGAKEPLIVSNIRMQPMRCNEWLFDVEIENQVFIIVQLEPVKIFIKI